MDRGGVGFLGKNGKGSGMILVYRWKVRLNLFQFKIEFDGRKM